jgi:hypothetical protein
VRSDLASALEKCLRRGLGAFANVPLGSTRSNRRLGVRCKIYPVATGWSVTERSVSLVATSLRFTFVMTSP